MIADGPPGVRGPPPDLAPPGVTGPRPRLPGPSLPKITVRYLEIIQMLPKFVAIIIYMFLNTRTFIFSYIHSDIPYRTLFGRTLSGRWSPY